MNSDVTPVGNTKAEVYFLGNGSGVVVNSCIVLAMLCGTIVVAASDVKGS